MPACAFSGPCLASSGDLLIGNYDDSDNVIQVCVDNVDECNDFMSWAINVATLCE